MTKKINFIPSSEEYSEWLVKPEPAISNIPDWFKDTGPYIGSDSLYLTPRGPNLSVKKCVPFFDAMTSGYYMFLSADIFVDPESKEGLISWLIDEKIVDTHDSTQLGKYLVPDNFLGEPLKWMNKYIINTPKGYSVYITHPQHRNDLPFHTLSGIVDSDSHYVPINFPFFLKKGFSGIIPKGTPIAQVFPFKRDDWKMSIEEAEKNITGKEKRFFSTIVNSYRKNIWSKKIYR